MHRLERLYRRVADRVDPDVKLAIMRKTVYNRSGPGVLLWRLQQRRALRRWLRTGRTCAPPAAAKHLLIRSYARAFGTRVLVETGTFLGDTIYALRNDFERIFSIELDPRLARDARRRFAHRSQVTILHGDSGVMLAGLLERLAEPTLFWLDAHWSGGVTAHGDVESPLLAELQLILQHTVDRHVVLIDDADLLGVRPSYPTLSAICELTNRLRPGWNCAEADAIVRLHP